MGNYTFVYHRLSAPSLLQISFLLLTGWSATRLRVRLAALTISGSDPADRFIMGLLRASADAIIVGARTVHDVSPKSLWTPEYTYPDAKHLYAEYRVDALHRSECTILGIVSGGGKLELEKAIFQTPAVRTVVVTTSVGREMNSRAEALRLWTPLRYML